MVIFKKYFLASLLLMPALASLAQQTNQNFEQGKICYNKADWDGVISNFTKTIEGSFNIADSYNYRAMAKAMKGNGNGAIADCNEAIKLEPNFAGNYYWRSQIQFVLTNYDAALADFKIGIRIEPKVRPERLARELSLICGGRAVKKCEIGDLDNAITNLNEAIYIAPTNSNTYALRGWLKLMQNRLDGAVSDAIFAVKFEPRNPFGYEVRAWARYERGDISGAVEDCKKVTENWSQICAKNPGFPAESEVYTSGGLLCFINGDFGKAVKEWNKFENSNTNLPSPMREFFQKQIIKAQAKTTK